MTLGENIRAYRVERNMSLEELAEKMRVGPKRIDDYETGRLIPSNETILKLSTILDIPANELISGSFAESDQRV